MVFCHRHVLKHLCHTLCRPAQIQQRLKALHCQQRQPVPWAFAFAATCTKGKTSEHRQLFPWAFAFAVTYTKGAALPAKAASPLGLCLCYNLHERQTQ